MNLAVLPMKAQAELVAPYLAGKKETIVRQWLELTIQSYDDEAAHFLRRDLDFRNPVGRILKENLPALFMALLEDRIPPACRQNLVEIIRVRAVQDFTPSEAVSFIFSLKAIVRRELADQGQLDPQGSGCAAIESRIDELALLAFDCYMKCREQICQIKLNESRLRSHVRERMALKASGRPKDSP